MGDFIMAEESKSDRGPSPHHDDVDDTLKIIGERALNKRDTLRVCLYEYEGRPCVSARKYYRDEASGELKPTRKGIDLSVTRLPVLVQLLTEALEDARSHGLVPLSPEGDR